MKTVLDTIYNTYHTMSHSGQESAIDKIYFREKYVSTSVESKNVALVHDI